MTAALRSIPNFLLTSTEKLSSLSPTRVMARIHQPARKDNPELCRTAKSASLTVIGKSLNHKSVQTTAIYARLEMDPVRESMNTTADEMLKLFGGGEKTKSHQENHPSVA